MFNKLAQVVLRLELRVLVQVPLKGVFGVFDVLQVGIPVVPIRKAAEEGGGRTPVVGASAFHLVEQEGLVERDDLLFQLLQNFFLRLVPDRDAALVEEMFGQGAVPVHSGDNICDAVKVGFRRLCRI